MKYLKPSIIHCITFFFFINIVFAQAEAEYIEKEFNRWAGDDSYSIVLNEDVYLQILVTDVTDSLGKSSQILSFYKKNIDNSFSFIGSMESIALGIEDYGEGLQFIYKHNNFIVIQQSFGAGRFLIISKLYLDFENDNTIKLVRYTEEHINRFIEDKDFAEIEYEIPNNIYLNNITRDTVYKLRQSKTKPWWEDSNGQAITKALVGDEVYLCFDVRYRAYADDVDGAPATIKIVEKDADGKDDPVTTLSAVVSGGKIKCQWQVTYTADDDDADSLKELEEKGYTLPEYAFVVECGGATSGESGVLEVYADFIAWGLETTPQGVKKHAKFRQYKFIEISSSIYNSYKNNYSSSIRYGEDGHTSDMTHTPAETHTHKDGKIHYNIPAEVFKNNLTTAGDFQYDTDVSTTYGLTATLSAGESIFWKLSKTKTL